MLQNLDCEEPDCGTKLNRNDRAKSRGKGVSKTKMLRCNCQFVAPTDSKLKDLGALAILGIQFFLYQRGQLSVPYDCLCSSEVSQSEEVDIPEGSTRGIEIPDEIVNPKERIRYLRRELKQKRIEMKRKQRRTIQTNEETRTKTSLEELFATVTDTLRDLELEGQGHLALVMSMGVNMLSIKESIVFEIISCADETVNLPRPEKNTVSVSLLAKKFYKRIILSDDFATYVSRCPRRCSSCFTLCTENPLDEAILEKYSLVSIPNPIVTEIDEMQEGTYLFSRQRGKLFHVRIIGSVVDQIQNSTISAKSELHKYFAYKFPMNFKGMRKVSMI